jgi:hypothetical protein
MSLKSGSVVLTETVLVAPRVHGDSRRFFDTASAPTSEKDLVRLGLGWGLR